MKRLLLLTISLATLVQGSRVLGEPQADGLYAGFITSNGEFWCRLEFEKAPRTVANFVSLAEGTRDWIDFPNARVVRRPFYPEITFHRVISGFMIQGGSKNGQGTDGPGYQFSDEFHPELRHSAEGTLSMANSGVDSNGSQFFVTVTNTPWLDDKHSVFGSVVEGMDVVHALSKVPVNANSRPLTPVVIQEVRIIRRGAAAEAFDPSQITPPLPVVGAVPVSLRVTTNNLTLLLQAQTNRFQHVLFSEDLKSWFLNSFRRQVLELDASSLRTNHHGFFRVLDGGFEP